tara:strand:- start:877 stop:1530 length:654 start_codon:yes stop_codon:yes gene_type:complete
MKFFVIIKEKSERLPGKNFLELGGIPLYKHLLKSLLVSSYEVFVDTDSDIILKDLKHKQVTCYKRKKEFIELENDKNFNVSPVLLMIENFLDTHVEYENEIIVTPHVTSPFIELSTIIDACKKLSSHDTVQACTRHKEFAYYREKPINFDQSVVQRTQDLEPIIMGNGAFFIFTKKTFKENKNRTGKNPYFYPLSFPENIEIDNKEDWELAKRVYGK